MSELSKVHSEKGMPPYPRTVEEIIERKTTIGVTTASLSPIWALGSVYVSEEEYERLKHE